MFFARTELATSMLSDRILAVGAPVCARVVALNGLTRQGFPLRCLKRTMASWATAQILTQLQNQNT